MAELSLPHEECLALRARAHGLAPVVLLGAAGLSAAVLQEIDRALRAHGLIKVRAGKAERTDRDAMFQTMAQQLGAARVQSIGHTFVLFRPMPKNAPQGAPRNSPQDPPKTKRRAGATKTSERAARPASARSAPKAASARVPRPGRSSARQR